MVPPDDELDDESPQALSTSEKARPPSAAPVTLIIWRLEMAPARRRLSPAPLAASRAATDPSVSGVLTLLPPKGRRCAPECPARSGPEGESRSAVQRLSRDILSAPGGPIL